MNYFFAKKISELLLWENLLKDEIALSRDPDTQFFLLKQTAQKLYRQRLINCKELADLIARAELTYYHHIEIQLLNKLNPKEIDEG
jgi:hypothetical protein